MLFQELDKLKRSSIMTSIVTAVLGIAMIICPDPFIPSLVATIGYTMLIVAIVMVLEFITSKRVLINYFYFTLALILGLFGAAVLIFDDNVVRMVGLVFGLAQIVSGISEIIYTLTYVRRSGRNAWWLMLVFSALTILFGLIVLVNPWWNDPGSLLDVIGGMLLFSSLVGIMRLIFIWPINSEQIRRA
ncbi:MAG: hypothetical protein E7317_10020 [Clostridiales bacterium]|nr:hypothetical protein [Clostridiales bacterium]